MPYSIRFYNFLRYSAAALYLFSFFGCKPAKKAEDLPQLASFIVDSVYLPLSVSNNTKLKIKEVPAAGGELVSFTMHNSFVNYTYDLGTQMVVDSISFAEWVNDYIDFWPIAIDSFVVGLSSNHILFISGRHKRKVSINPIITAISQYAYIGYLSAEPIHIFGDTVMVTSTTTEMNKDNLKPNAPFLKVNYDVAVKITGDTAVLIAKNNPNPDYFYIQDYYTFVERVFLNSRQIVYSYSHSDTLTVLNLYNGLKKNAVFQTGYFKCSKPFDYSRQDDMGYITSYCMSQCRSSIGDLMYDKYNHHILQFMKHEGVYIDSITGRKNSWDDIPQSLFIFDEHLQQQKELLIEPGCFGATMKSFITSKGFYIPAAHSKQKYHDKMLFYKLRLP